MLGDDAALLRPLPSGVLGPSPGLGFSRGLALALHRVSCQEPDCDPSFTLEPCFPFRPHNDFSVFNSNSDSGCTPNSPELPSCRGQNAFTKIQTSSALCLRACKGFLVSPGPWTPLCHGSKAPGTCSVYPFVPSELDPSQNSFGPLEVAPSLTPRPRPVLVLSSQTPARLPGGSPPILPYLAEMGSSGSSWGGGDMGRVASPGIRQEDRKLLL